jgi:antitoxin VapB
MISTVRGRIGNVPTLNIKDPEVYELASELARRLGTSMTNAVRMALLDAVQRERRVRDDYVERMSELARLTRDASKHPILTDDDLYDHRGLPR